MAIILTGIIGAYFILTLVFLIVWLAMRPFTPQPTYTPNVPVTVVIAVRNEAENIGLLLEDLNRQTYPAKLLEVIVVDDHSTDDTVRIIDSFINNAKYQLRLLQLSHYVVQPLPQGNYKKKALEVAVSEASGTLILTTDGDCRVSEQWVNTFAQFHEKTGAQFISGVVTFHQERRLFECLQTVEFASLIGSGAATLALGVPTMCNGANLAYTKSAFTQVGGYSGADGIASGDDMFLLHKIEQAFPRSALFMKSQQAMVYTKAQSSWWSFYHQRKRWASKWRMYADWRVSVLAVFIFAGNFALTLALTLLIWGNYPIGTFWTQIALKFSIEFVFLTLVLRFLNKSNFILLIIPLQTIYFLYVSFFGLAAQKKGYQWKGRKLQ